MRYALSAALFLASTLAAVAQPADDRAKLQGVWHSPAGAKLPLRLLVLGDKAGYLIGDATATPPVPGSAFVGLTDARFGPAHVEVVVTKDYTRRLEYRFEKGQLVVTLDKAEYPLARVNTRGDDPAAKPLAGAWAVTEVAAKGMSAPGRAAGFESLTFAGDRYVLRGTGGKEIVNSFYRVGATKDGRAELDVFGFKADPTFVALVEVKGDDLTLSQPLRPGGPRPAGFDSAAAEILVIRAARMK